MAENTTNTVTDETSTASVVDENSDAENKNVKDKK